MTPAGIPPSEVVRCDERIAEFRSVERLDPTTVAIYPDRVVVTHGEADAAPRVVPILDLAEVRVRTVFRISSLRLHTTNHRIVVADLLSQADAASAKAEIQGLMSSPVTCPAPGIGNGGEPAPLPGQEGR